MDLKIQHLALISCYEALANVSEAAAASWPDMAHDEYAGLEILGHYITVSGPGSELEVLGILSDRVGPFNVERGNRCPPLVTMEDGRTIMFVDVDPGPDHEVVLTIGNLDHDDQACLQAARSIYVALASATLWRLRFSSDINPVVFVMHRAC